MHTHKEDEHNFHTNNSVFSSRKHTEATFHDRDKKSVNSKLAPNLNTIYEGPKPLSSD